MLKDSSSCRVQSLGILLPATNSLCHRSGHMRSYNGCQRCPAPSPWCELQAPGGSAGAGRSWTTTVQWYGPRTHGQLRIQDR
ncbi:hypothetical protein [Pseudomonas phage PIP]|nr:hypothetical protein [Pseudomonas phage PIP]